MARRLIAQQRLEVGDRVAWRGDDVSEIAEFRGTPRLLELGIVVVADDYNWWPQAAWVEAAKHIYQPPRRKPGRPRKVV